MKKFMRMQIHSSCSSWSSNDEMLYKEVYDTPKGYADTFGDDLIEVFCYEDKTYYHDIRKDATKDQIKKLVSKYVGEGWSTRRPADLNEYSKRQDARHIEARRKLGCVIVGDYDYDKYNRKDFKGSLSDELWDHSGCVQYTSRPCFGYYGHSGRTYDIDEFIEAEFKRNGASLDEIHIWMSSSYARHAMDYHEGESFEVNKEFIEQNVPRWIDQAKEMFAKRGQHGK